MSTSHLPPKLLSVSLHTKGKAKIALVVVFTALGLGFVPFVKIYDDGQPPLAVMVRSAAGDPIIAASGEAFVGTTDAASALEHLAPPESIYSATQDPFRGEALAVPVPTSCTIHRSLLWEYRRRFQFTKLVVIVRYEDGRQEGRLVDIPDLRRTRELTVEVP